MGAVAQWKSARRMRIHANVAYPTATERGRGFNPRPPPSFALLAAARHLFKTGHAASPFMTLDSGPSGVSINMKVKTLDAGQAVHSALVRFFTANTP